MLLHAWQAAAGTPHALRLASDVIPRNRRTHDADTGDHAASLVALRVATQARGQFLHTIDRRAGCHQEQESHIRQRMACKPYWLRSFHDDRLHVGRQHGVDPASRAVIAHRVILCSDALVEQPQDRAHPFQDRPNGREDIALQ
jgi:hypothetical protein